MRQSAIFGVIVATVTSLTAAVNASVVTIYTDKTLWENALAGLVLTEDFDDLVLNDGVSFVSSESGHINPALGEFHDVLASTSGNEPMTTWTFIPQLVAFGGNWTLAGPGGSGNSLLVSIADTAEHVGTIQSSYYGEFWGFISDTPFSSVKLIGGLGTHQQNYILDDMVYSQVPEPAPLILFALGLLWLVRRHRTA